MVCERTGNYQTCPLETITNLYLLILAMNNFPAAMSITVSGGSFEENQQLCSVLSASLKNVGFTSVKVDAGSSYSVSGMHDENLVACVRAINPDLFETPVIVQGECESDMQMQLACMGFQGFSVGVSSQNPFQ